MPRMKIRKAVFPVAGLGTRVLPATKAMPKEMLTIVDRPLIQYVVDEAQGSRHRAFHLRHRPQQGRDRGSFRPHVRTRRDAGARGNKKAEMDIAGARPARSRRHELHPPAGAARPRPRGVVRARHRRRRAVRGGAAGRTGAEQRRAACADDRGRRQARRQSQRPRGRGSADGPDAINTASSASASATRSNMFEIDGMVEKPPKGTAPSNLSITGRYILQPEIFKILETQERGAGGEIQLTDAMIGSVEDAEVLRRASSRASATIAARRPASCAPTSPSACSARAICATACARCGEIDSGILTTSSDAGFRLQARRSACCGATRRSARLVAAVGFGRVERLVGGLDQVATVVAAVAASCSPRRC